MKNEMKGYLILVGILGVITVMAFGLSRGAEIVRASSRQVILPRVNSPLVPEPPTTTTVPQKVPSKCPGPDQQDCFLPAPPGPDDPVRGPQVGSPPGPSQHQDIPPPPSEEVVCNAPEELTKRQNRAVDMLIMEYTGPLEVTKDLTDRPDRAGVVIGEHCVIVFDTGAPEPPFDMSDYFDKCVLGGRTIWNCPTSWDPQNQPQTGTP